MPNTYRKFIWVDPVVFRKLHIKLHVKITFFKGITILWHSFTSNYMNTSWFNYFARGVFHHNLTSIKVLKCELKPTKSFNKSYLICHVQIIPISLEHLQMKQTRNSGTMEACSVVLCYFNQFKTLILPFTAKVKLPPSLSSLNVSIYIRKSSYSEVIC